MFIIEYLKNPMTVGAFAPSSRRLAKKMVKPIDFTNCKCIVEFGPGTGVFTDEIILHKGEDTVLILIEQSKQFCDELSERYKNKQNVHVVHGDAIHVEQYLKKFGQKKADYIVSGLPFTSLPKEISKDIFSATKKVIGNSGKFITFQYSLIKKKMFLQWFKLENTTYEAWNFPPAFILEMRN